MDVKIFTDNIEGEALNQVYTLAKQDVFKDAKIRIMPDVHAGAGCVIGFTANLGDKVVPNIVGVDIGCGMLTVELEDNISDMNLEEIDKIIRKYVPAGRNIHDLANGDSYWKELYCQKALKNTEVFDRSVGTLGGGNHFIEIDTDENGTLYLVIHTGSRNMGKQVAEYYQNIAIKRFSEQKQMNDVIQSRIKELKAEGNERMIQQEIEKIQHEFHALPKVPRELSYLEDKDRDDYLHDMRLCQDYAKLNRNTIADIIIKQAGLTEVSRFETVHNYIGDDNIIRKGAISAYKDQMVLIPLNMRDGCIIGIGKGNDDWNQSAPHGAGRALSRSKARENITLAAYEKSMEGIFTTSVSMSTIDESPLAYKSAEEIMCLIDDTVIIDKIIKPVYNFKASESREDA